ncbi:FtsX-like permease family protein [Streptomyces sp. YJ-C3]
MSRGTEKGFLLAAALVNSLIVATAERRGEFALRRLIGSTRRQVLWMMSVEAMVTAVVGMVLGTGVATGSLVSFGLALDGTVLPSGPGWICVTIVATAVVLTFVTVLLPTALALRTKLVEAAVAP